jgi:hypothetical protein
VEYTQRYNYFQTGVEESNKQMFRTFVTVFKRWHGADCCYNGSMHSFLGRRDLSLQQSASQCFDGRGEYENNRRVQHPVHGKKFVNGFGVHQREKSVDVNNK